MSQVVLIWSSKRANLIFLDSLYVWRCYEAERDSLRCLPDNPVARQATLERAGYGATSESRVISVRTTPARTARRRRRACRGAGPVARPDRLYRLGVFFPDRALLLSDLTTAKCAAYYEALRGRVNRLGRPFAVDSHRSMLAEARMATTSLHSSSQGSR